MRKPLACTLTVILLVASSVGEATISDQKIQQLLPYMSRPQRDNLVRAYNAMNRICGSATATGEAVIQSQCDGIISSYEHLKDHVLELAEAERRKAEAARPVERVEKSRSSPLPPSEERAERAPSGPVSKAPWGVTSVPRPCPPAGKTLPPGIVKRSVYQVKELRITAYNAVPEQTDSTPNETASGTAAVCGVVAANDLPIGAYVSIPELYGDRWFRVEDRMANKTAERGRDEGRVSVDILFNSIADAERFGVKRHTGIVLIPKDQGVS